MNFLKEMFADFSRKGFFYYEDRGDKISASFEGEIWYEVWKINGRWVFGSRERAQESVSILVSEEQRPVLNWFVRVVSPGFSECSIVLPSSAEEMRPGWRVVETDNPSYKSLVDSYGKQRNIKMLCWGSDDSRLVEMSWIVDADPLELLNSYLDPQGRPLLTRFVKED